MRKRRTFDVDLALLLLLHFVGYCAVHELQHYLVPVHRLGGIMMLMDHTTLPILLAEVIPAN